MAAVTVRMNGRDYTLACDDGQEEQLIALSQEVDERVRQLSGQVQHAGEVMLFLLTSIMLADELADTRRQCRQLQGRLSRLEEQVDPEQIQQDKDRVQVMEADMANTLDAVAERIERITGLMPSS